MRGYRRWLLAMAAMILMMVQTATAGPAVYGLLGVENPPGAKEGGDLLLTAGGGLEWPGVFGSEEWQAVGQYTKVGWGDSDVEEADRWNFGVKLYLTSYWPAARPFVIGGLEQNGPSLIVGQVCETWAGAGVEPAFAHGWLQATVQTTRWAMDEPNRWRFAVALIPSKELSLSPEE
jgi:hypothetical protein